MVHHLLGELQRQGLTEYRVLVIHPDASMLQRMQTALQSCYASRPTASFRIAYEQLNATQYLQRVLAFNQLHPQSPQLFDYIESYGAINRVAMPQQHVEQLLQLLTETGALGLSYFSSNEHTERLRAMLASIYTNSSQDEWLTHLPFSSEPRHFVRYYLDIYRLTHLRTDHVLLRLLQNLHEDNAVRLYDARQARELVERAGGVLRAQLPGAYSRPYGELYPSMQLDPHSSCCMLVMQRSWRTIASSVCAVQACPRSCYSTRCCSSSAALCTSAALMPCSKERSPHHWSGAESCCICLSTPSSCT
jgi:hypothetical protein